MARKRAKNQEEGTDWDSISQDDLLQTEDLRYQMKVFNLVEKFQDAVPYLKSGSRMRRLLAEYGEAYFFFNKTGELCFLTDFVPTHDEQEIMLME